MSGRFFYKDATMVVDTGTTGVIETDADSAVADVSDLENISVYLNQVTDNGNATLLVEKTVDGTNWATVASKTQADFPAGANKSVELTLSDSNGMPTRAKQIRVTLSGHSGTGTYTMGVAGTQVDGYR